MTITDLHKSRLNDRISLIRSLVEFDSPDDQLLDQLDHERSHARNLNPSLRAQDIDPDSVISVF